MRGPELPERTPVLVVGGGPVGLVVSLLLSQRGIPHVVSERREDSQRAPAAHVVRRRPMEILDSLGVGDAVRRAAPPLDLDFITWCATLGGAEVGRLDLCAPDPATGVRPPPVWTNCPQNLLEPVLHAAAAARPEACIVRGAECVHVVEDGDGAVATIRTPDGPRRIATDWVVAADGAASPTRRALGIAMEGPGPLARFAMVHFEADLSPWIDGRSGPLYWILNPEAIGTVIVHDPVRSHVFMTPLQEGEEASEETVAPRLAAALAIPVVPKILSVDSWSPHVQVADRYRAGRVLLVGDAAHRFPPTGGLGMNTGIQEAAVLVELLAPVIGGEAGEETLDRYEAVCRPVARANADESFANAARLFEINRVIGDCRDLAALERRIAGLSADERARLAEAIEAQRSHFLSDGTLPAL